MAKNKKKFSDKIIDYVSAVAGFLRGDEPDMISPLPDGYNPSSGFTGKTTQIPEGTPNVITGFADPTKEEIARMKAAKSISNSGKVKEAAANIPEASQEFLNLAGPIFDEYGIPVEVGMAMYGAEGRGQGLGADRNNFFNINAIDSDPNQAYGYDTPEAGVRAYAELLARKYPSAMKLANDPVAMVRKIEELGYAGDPATYDQRATAANPVTGKPFTRYSDFIMATPEWRAFYNQR